MGYPTGAREPFVWSPEYTPRRRNSEDSGDYFWPLESQLRAKIQAGSLLGGEPFQEEYTLLTTRRTQSEQLLHHSWAMINDLKAFKLVTLTWIIQGIIGVLLISV